MRKVISEKEFLNSYWYLKDLKDLSKKLGIKNTTHLRKDELENLILGFIKYGKIKTKPRKNKQLEKDILDLGTLVRNYRNTTFTKDFILKESLKLVPSLKIRSGVKYWLNRYIDKNLNKIKYKDIVKEFIRLNNPKTKLPQIPSTKMNNFISDYLVGIKNSKRQEAMIEWRKLKKWKVPKNFTSYLEYKKNV
jgi:hypothetical protein